MRKAADKEQIDLLRCGSVVSSFAGAFGSSLRETRLTAMLGYGLPPVTAQGIR